MNEIIKYNNISLLYKNSGPIDTQFLQGGQNAVKSVVDPEKRAFN